MTTIFVTPAAGLKVRDPKGGHLPAGGGPVDPRDPYWRRRLRDGDVRQSAAPAGEGKTFEIADGDNAKPPTKAPIKAKETRK